MVRGPRRAIPGTLAILPMAAVLVAAVPMMTAVPVAIVRAASRFDVAR
jgi:hypothetical protein